MAAPGYSVDEETKLNAQTLQCIRCSDIILRKGNASLHIREKVVLPVTKRSQDAGAAAKDDSRDEEEEFWKVKGVFTFENIGVSHTVGTFKYLTCANCEIDTLGFGNTAEEADTWFIAAKRVGYKE